jgi:hypothetical protein
MANTRRLRTLPEGSRHYGNQNGRYQDLGSKCEPETPLRCITDQGPSSTADNADENGDETPNGLHARNQNSSDEANNYSNKEPTDEARDFHGATQPLLHPIGQVPRAEKGHENIFSDSRL